MLDRIEQKICEILEAKKDEIIAFGNDIWNHAELGYKEVRTSGKFVEEMTKLGGSLMIAPDITYEASLYLKQQMEDGEVKTHQNLISLVSSEGQFTAGSQYLVSATIYGLTSIDISVKTTDWQEGGSIDVGNDKFEE